MSDIKTKKRLNKEVTFSNKNVSQNIPRVDKTVWLKLLVY